MKKLLIAAALMGILTVGIAGQSSADDWYTTFRGFDPLNYQFGGGKSDGGMFLGSVSGMTSGYDDALDVEGIGPAAPPDGAIRVKGFNSSFNPSKVAQTDIRGAFTGAIGETETWTLGIWSVGPAASNPNLNLYINFDDLDNLAANGQVLPSTIGGNPMKYELFMTRIPTGVSYIGPIYWNLTSTLTAGNGFIIPLATSANTKGPDVTSPWDAEGNQSFGYGFEFKASVVPEPGSMMVLASGLVGLAGIIRRKRS